LVKFPQEREVSCSPTFSTWSHTDGCMHIQPENGMPRQRNASSTVCLNSFGNQTSPSDNSNDC